MFFIRRKGTKQGGKPTSREFILKGIVQSMSLMEHPFADERQICLVELYSKVPVLVNGETEHRFSIYVPNHQTAPRFNRDRMKFWLCYGHQQPVVLDEDGEPSVPLIGREDCEYFKGMALSFICQVIQLEDGNEVVEHDYSPEN